MENYYAVLGVDNGSPSSEIKRAYKKLAMQYHPDRHGGDQDMFQLINEAHQVLSEPTSKRRYDAQLREAIVTNPREYVHILWEKVI